jgi:hypothetical protein
MKMGECRKCEGYSECLGTENHNAAVMGYKEMDRLPRNYGELCSDYRPKERV